VFYCADDLGETGDDDGKYYESIGLVDAFHPQTILAYDMNGARRSPSRTARRSD
jgi:DMSO/TMAO reductase YedYZ molybdopterin-dependent catalytic subunit